MVATTQQFPPMPEIGRPDVFYTHAIEIAEQEGDIHRRAALKVARYITLGLDPNISWDAKRKYFLHALKHHCAAPTADEPTQQYYQQLAELVRQYAGAEALRLASAEDDMYAARLALEQDRTQIEDDAENFFGKILNSSEHCPEHFNSIDWEQLKLLRDQWI